MKFLLKLLLPLCTAWAVAGCSGSDSSDDSSTIESMRFAQASYDLTEGQSVTPVLFLRPVGGMEFENEAVRNLFEVTFQIANPAVASVSASGAVTALAKGTTTLTARSPYCATSATAQIVVSEGVETLKIESIRFQEPEYSVETGKSVQPQLWVLIKGEASEFRYDAAKNPYRMVWKSSDTSVATVSLDGTVRALKAGTTTLSARTDLYDGSATTTIRVLSDEVTNWVGEWVLSSWTGDASLAGKVYMELTDKKAFNLYQNINALGFAKLTGTYSVTSVAQGQVISGTYTDGKSWGDSYTVTATDKKLTLTGRTTGYVSVYDRTTIPDYVKDGVSVQTTRSPFKPFL